MLRAMRRGLETGLRRLLHGHEGGNSGYGQEAAYGLPRQFPTLPGWEINYAVGKNYILMKVPAWRLNDLSADHVVGPAGPEFVR